MTLRVTCDDHLELYLDGVQQQHSALKIWQQESTFEEITSKLEIIALKCVNTGGPGGIIASLENEDGDVVFYTDTYWKCSSVLEEGWQLSGFQDTSDNWHNAIKKGDNGDPTWGFIKQISHDADWIWARAGGTVYCRGVVFTKGKNNILTRMLILGILLISPLQQQQLYLSLYESHYLHNLT